MALRVARCQDWEVLAQLNDHPDIYFPALKQTVLEKTTWWVAWQDGKPVGFAGARVDQFGWCFFERCGVLRCARGQRLQQRFIRARLAWGKKQGATGAYTYTLPDRAASQNSLIRAGFRTYRPNHLFAGESAVYWRKRF